MRCVHVFPERFEVKSYSYNIQILSTNSSSERETMESENGLSVD